MVKKSLVFMVKILFNYIYSDITKSAAEACQAELVLTLLSDDAAVESVMFDGGRLKCSGRYFRPQASRSSPPWPRRASRRVAMSAGKVPSRGCVLENGR